MRINHNIQALNAYRNLNQNQFATSKNLEKLSSGLRINRAADDAAGLAISEKMRSQIRGLNQAERNSLDGVSLMQTAEGAMTEVHSMLQRMRELAVQGANDTNTTQDREQIQKEIDQLLLEIDSIATKTEFNTRKLLDGSSAVDTQFITGEMQKTNMKGVPVVADPALPTGRYQVSIETKPSYEKTLNQPGAGVSEESVLDVNLDSIFKKNEAENTNLKTPPTVTDSTLAQEPGTYRINVASGAAIQTPVLTSGGTGIAVGGTDTDFIVNSSGSELPLGKYEIIIDRYDSSAKTADITVKDPNGRVLEKKEGVSTASGQSNVTFGSTTDKQVALNLTGITSNGTAKIDVEAKVKMSVEKIKPDGTVESIEVSAGTFTTSGGVVNLGSKFDLDIPPSIKTGSSTFDVTSNLQFGEYTVVVSKYQVDNNNVKSATIEVLDPDGFSIGEKAAEIADDGGVVVIGTEDGRSVKIDTTKITQAGTAKIQLEGKMEVSVSRMNDDNTSTPITFSKEITTQNGIVKHGGLEMEYGVNVIKGASEFDLTNKALAFQIGANSDQNVKIDVPQLSTVKLGISEIDVTSHVGANDAIFKLDQAINQISTTRSKLGATQNRLEHTINNLQTTNENLTAAESRIRDADMAKEMTEFTRNNILNQSAQAMLAQANQLPQGVLQLLQG